MSGRSHTFEFDCLYPPRDSQESLSGKIGFYKGTAGNESNWMLERFGSKPAICIQYHSSLQWIPLGMLSGANLKKYRENIETQYGLLYKKFIGSKKRIQKLKENSKDNGDEAFMAHLWSSYDSRIQSDVMQEMLNQFHKSTFSKKTCSVCLKFSPTKKNCMHKSCFGMCLDCHKESFGTELDPIECKMCPCCKREQTDTCPICQEDKKESELIHGDNCSHSVCCKCFCASFNSHPIIECPLCRAGFKKTLHQR